MSMIFDILKKCRLPLLIVAAGLVLSACSNSSDEGGMMKTDDIATAQSENAGQGMDCWQGHILTTIYKVIGTTIMTQYDNLSKGSLSLMMIGFAVWAALRLLKFVSSVTESSPAEIWNELIRKAFICLFCGYLAYSSGTLLVVINAFIFPIYGAFLEFGAQLLQLSDSQVSSVTVFGETVEFSSTNFDCGVVGDSKATLEGFPDSFQVSMNCMICNLADKLRVGRQMAWTAMSMKGVIPWLSGLLVWFIFLVVGIGFVFYLVDSLFRFGMMILMLPIFIMAFAFGPTKKWTGIGFKNIMHSAVFMMMFAIVTATTLLAMVALLTEKGELFNPTDPENHFRQLSLVSLCLLLMGFLMFKSMDVSQSLTSGFIGAHIDAKFQQNLKAVLQACLHIITQGATWGLTKSGFMEKTKVGRLLGKGGAFKNKMSELAGRPVKNK